MQHQAFRMNKLSQKQTSTSAFEAPEKFWKAKKDKSCRQNSKSKNVLCFFFSQTLSLNRYRYRLNPQIKGIE